MDPVKFGSQVAKQFSRPLTKRPSTKMSSVRGSGKSAEIAAKKLPLDAPEKPNPIGRKMTKPPLDPSVQKAITTTDQLLRKGQQRAELLKQHHPNVEKSFELIETKLQKHSFKQEHIDILKLPLLKIKELEQEIEKTPDPHIKEQLKNKLNDLKSKVEKLYEWMNKKGVSTISEWLKKFIKSGAQDFVDILIYSFMLALLAATGIYQLYFTEGAKTEENKNLINEVNESINESNSEYERLLEDWDAMKELNRFSESEEQIAFDILNDYYNKLDNLTKAVDEYASSVNTTDININIAYGNKFIIDKVGTAFSELTLMFRRLITAQVADNFIANVGYRFQKQHIKEMEIDLQSKKEEAQMLLCQNRLSEIAIPLQEIKSNVNNFTHVNRTSLDDMIQKLSNIGELNNPNNLEISNKYKEYTKKLNALENQRQLLESLQTSNKPSEINPEEELQLFDIMLKHNIEENKAKMKSLKKENSSLVKEHDLLTNKINEARETLTAAETLIQQAAKVPYKK